MTAIHVRELRKSYHGVSAVDGIDLDVQAGEVFALLGPNGAGKTTTVEILEGFRRRDSGEATALGGDPGRQDAAWRSRIGIVLQNAGGQRRRLDVALGILGRPELLFLDEPTTGFDPEARRAFWTLVESLAADGTTIVLTTHYLDEAERLAGRVGVIAAGRIVAVDTPDRLGRRDDQQVEVRWDEDRQPRSLTTAEPTTVVRQLADRFAGEVPVVAGPLLILMFISGVFFVYTDLPGWLQDIAASWKHGTIAVVLTVWSIAGLALCARTFRWQRRDDR